MKIIYLNGPSKSGKDTLGNELSETLGFCERLKFAAPIKRAAAALMECDVSQFEDQEFKAMNIFGDVSYTFRDLLIGLSETLLKPALGRDVFGKLLAREIQLSNDMGFFDTHIVTDCGFKEEIEAVVRAFPQAEHYLFRLHREGCDFTGDSRSYIKDLTGVKEYDIYNDTTIGAAVAVIADKVKQ